MFGPKDLKKGGMGKFHNTVENALKNPRDLKDPRGPRDPLVKYTEDSAFYTPYHLHEDEQKP